MARKLQLGMQRPEAKGPGLCLPEHEGKDLRRSSVLGGDKREINQNLLAAKLDTDLLLAMGWIGLFSYDPDLTEKL